MTDPFGVVTDEVGGEIDDGDDGDDDDADTLTDVSLIVVVMFMDATASVAGDDPETLTRVSVIVIAADAIALEEVEAESFAVYMRTE